MLKYTTQMRIFANLVKNTVPFKFFDQFANFNLNFFSKN